MALTAAQRAAALEEKKKVASQAQGLYGQYVEGSGQVGSLATKAVRGALGSGTAITAEIEGLKEQRKLMPTAYAAELREGRFAGDPILAGRLAAQREANIQRRLGEAQGLRTQQEGNVAEIAGAVTAGYQAQTDKARIEADKAQQDFANQLSINQFAAQEEERKRQAEALTWINAGGKSVGVDTKGNVVRTITHTATPSSKTTSDLTPSKTLLDQVAAIFKSQDLLSNKAKEGRTTKQIEAAAEDMYISQEEIDKAMLRIMPLVGNDREKAAILGQNALTYAGMKNWDKLSKEEQNKISGYGPKNNG